MSLFLSKRFLIPASQIEVIFLYHDKETSQVYKKAYKKGKSPYSPGIFRF